MLLEKLKQHSGKIMFFVMNILVVITGVFFMKQKGIEKNDIAVADANALSISTLDAQPQVTVNQEKAINGVSGNFDTAQQAQTVSVAKTIPVVTKTAIVQQQRRNTLPAKTKSRAS